MISVEGETGYPLLLQEDTVLVARRVVGATAVPYILVNLAAMDRVEGDFRAAEGDSRRASAASADWPTRRGRPSR